MRFSTATAATTALVAGLALAEPLATITPCPGANITTAPPITVTRQYQTVSTCSTTSACFRGSCVTKYPFQSYAYVNTAIPCAWDGTSVHTTTVTATAQNVTVSRFQTTITKFVTPTPVWVSGTTRHPTPTPVYLTIAKDFIVPYNEIGPLAIPGYGGSGLCTNCDIQSDGSRSQIVDVIECRSSPDGPQCMGYAETWVSQPAPSATATTAVHVSTQFVAPTAGTYTFTFPVIAPSHVWTAGTQTVTVGPSPYFVYATRGCNGPHQTIDFTTTVTQTIYYTVPFARQPPTASRVVPVPTGHHAFPGFPGHSQTTSLPENDGGDNFFGWADWGSDQVTNPAAPLPSEWADWALTASTTTTTTTTTTPSSSPSDSASFYITVNTGSKYHKRASRYVGFGSGGDGVIVDDVSQAALFKLVSGYLMSGGLYVDVDLSQAYVVFSLVSTLPAKSAQWSISGGVLTIVATIDGFCVNPDDSTLFIVISSEPSFTCNAVTFNTESPSSGKLFFLAQH